MKKLIIGYTLIEILVVLGIFALLATLSTQAVFLTIRSSRKSEAAIKVRENLNYSIMVMEREIRNAKTVIGCTADSRRVNYTNLSNVTSYFACETSSGNTTVASGSSSMRLTGTEVNLTSCSFTCSNDGSGNLQSVSINLVGSHTTIGGTEGVSIPMTTQVFIR